MSSNLLINESPLQVLPSLALAVGLNEAIILQQVHFWVDKKMKKPEKYEANSFIGGHWWVWNSVPEWQAQFPFWGDNTIRRALTTLRQLGVLICEQLSADRYDKTLFYRIDYEALDRLTIKKPEQKGSSKKKQAQAQGTDAFTQNGQTAPAPNPNVGTSSTQNGHMTSTQGGQSHITRPGQSLSENSSRELQKLRQSRAPTPQPHTQPTQAATASGVFALKGKKEKEPPHAGYAVHKDSEARRQLMAWRAQKGKAALAVGPGPGGGEEGKGAGG